MTAIVSLAVLILAIYILAVITDKFFVKSLEQISQVWKIPPSVAGASLMAMGSSAPELFIAMLALFKDGGANSDVGIGTIVGSAVFNILVITGISAVIRDAKVTLPAIVRDTVFYLISIGFLLYVFWDGQIVLSESILFIVIYGGYLAFLFLVPMGDEFEEPVKTEEKLSDTKGESRLQIVNRAITKNVGYLTGDAEKDYIRAFLASIFLIGALSWVLVDSAVIFANALGIPPVIIALTILAGGTSAPDLIASVIVARQGQGSMAVANAIGSNIFDILICLGLPWTIALLFLDRGTILVGTGELLLSVFILVSTVVVLFIFLYTGRVLTRREGWCLLGFYATYILWTVFVG